jgi:hypothetical protein
MTIEYTPLASSNLAGAAYNPTERTLRIKFTNGAEYEYDAVPPDVFAGLFACASPGQYHAREIKGKFAYRKVNGPPDAP